MTSPIAPHLLVSIAFKLIEDCQRFATEGGTLFTPAQTTKAEETIMLNMGK